ncbi:hypothetical protein DFJ74DRAFT_629853 [Hyaloraphidium curvatum]|nr:hypothetical protein DFJ74DRAFT_629853 [Hyaloraphidium curvatum]
MASRVLRLAWRQLPASGPVPLGRSSHAAAVVGRAFLAFSGENEPRVPVDAALHAYDVDAKKWEAPVAPANAPSARVGHSAAAANGTLFVLAGRTGVGTDQGLASMDLHAFDPKSGSWSVRHPGADGPAPRSYAALVAAPDSLLLFGGVAAAGRTSDLWSFGPLSSPAPKWSQLSPQAPFSVRGGPGLALLRGHLVLFGGFNGAELGDVHVWPAGGTDWLEPHVIGEKRPGARSVLGFAPLSVSLDGRKEDVLLALYGERDPSPYGHVGAGKYWDDVWALRLIEGEDGLKAEWLPCEVAGEKPAGRGWWVAASVPARDGGGYEAVLCHGGFDGKDRLGDLWEIRQAEA